MTVVYTIVVLRAFLRYFYQCILLYVNGGEIYLGGHFLLWIPVQCGEITGCKSKVNRCTYTQRLERNFSWGQAAFQIPLSRDTHGYKVLSV